MPNPNKYRNRVEIQNKESNQMFPEKDNPKDHNQGR